MTIPGFPALSPPSAQIGQALPVLYRQGTIIAWNSLTLQSTVRIDGVDFTDLPVLGLSEAGTYGPGDVVGILVAGQTMAIIGQMVRPNTADASSALSLLSAFIKTDTINNFENVTSTSYGNLTTTGPTVSNVHIGPSGKALVLLTAEVNVNEQGSAVWMSFSVSGASTITTSDGRALKLGKSGTLVAANMIFEAFMTSAVYLDFLTPGDNTFQAKYRIGSTAGVASAQAGNRNITVIPL